MVPGDDRKCWSCIWPAWSDIHGRKEPWRWARVYWPGTALECLGQKAAISETREHCTGAWRRSYITQVHTYGHEGFSPSAFHIACVCSNTSLFSSQMSWDLVAAILEKNLEGTLATAGTLILYSFPWAVDKVSHPHWAYGLSSARRRDLQGRPWSFPHLNHAPKSKEKIK